MDIYERAKSDLEKLCHTLGIDKHIHESKWGYRNYYDAGPDAIPAMERLREAGLVELVRGTYYRATKKGAEYVGLRGKQLKRALGGDGE